MTTPDETADDRLFQVDKEEYTRLKAEQNDRIKTRAGIVTGWVTAVLLIAHAARQDPGLLLTLAPIGVVSCWLWTGENEKITEARRFITGTLSPRISQLCGNRPVLRWEKHHQAGRYRLWVKLTDAIIAAALFSAPGWVGVALWVSGPQPKTAPMIACLIVAIASCIFVAVKIGAGADLPARPRR